jgi:hypothetical protein
LEGAQTIAERRKKFNKIKHKSGHFLKVAEAISTERLQTRKIQFSVKYLIKIIKFINKSRCSEIVGSSNI